MKRPWSKDDYQREFADEIIRQIERGVAPWQKPWKPGERGSPENFHTGKSYTGGNNIYLAVRGVKKGYGDNRWGTYRQIAEAGGQVRKAERGAKILFFDRQYREAVKDQDGKPVKDGEGKQVYKTLDRARPFWRSFTVFNVEQAEGLQLERRDGQAAPEWERHRNAELVIRASDVPVNHVGRGPGLLQHGSGSSGAARTRTVSYRRRLLPDGDARAGPRHRSPRADEPRIAQRRTRSRLRVGRVRPRGAAGGDQRHDDRRARGRRP